jgi:DNA (cytosine-5)-methyltransferase 1
MRTTIDLFAGAGGASLGLKNAGMHHELCVEWDEDAAATLVASGFPGVCGDVRDLKHYEDMKHIDMMWASPPCQAFSSAGKREGALDDRNGWPWTLDVIDHLRLKGIGPGWVICENVLGLTYHKSDCTGHDVMECAGCYWEQWILPEFKKRFDWVGTAVLNAADFGVPQFRRRVFLVGGDRAVRWPEGTHCSEEEMKQQSMFGPKKKPWVTIGQALGLDSTVIGISSNPSNKGESGQGLRTYKEITHQPSTGITTRGPMWNQGPFVVEDDKPDWWHRASPVDEPSRTIGTKGNASVTQGTGVPGSEPWRLDKPAPAVTSRDWRGARHQKFDPTRTPMTAADATWRAVGKRSLTWQECAILQGFPSDHPFTGRTKASIYKQVGNAVCPIVSEVLARCVMEAMDT